MIRLASVPGFFRCGLAAFGFAAAATSTYALEKAGPSTINWDQVENIKGAAARIGRIQRARGAEVAMTLISNCYKTHTLFENYSRGFESCLVQDHLQTRVLVEVYSRMQPEALRRIGAPSKESLMRANVARFEATLAKYKFPPNYGSRIRKMTNEHGWPVFVKIVFPKIKQDQGAAKSRKKPIKRR